MLLTGYLESSLNRNFEADLLFYYKGVTNSHVFLIAGNIVTALAGYLYGKTRHAILVKTNQTSEDNVILDEI